MPFNQQPPRTPLQLNELGVSLPALREHTPWRAVGVSAEGARKNLPQILGFDWMVWGPV